MGRRAQHSREQLQMMALYAARKLVREEGEAALTMRNIARHIGYTPGMLYHLFPDQDALVALLAEDVMYKLLEAMEKAVAASTYADEALLKMGQAYLSMAQEDDAMWRLIWNYPYKRVDVRSENYHHIIHQLLLLAAQTLRMLHAESSENHVQLLAKAWLSGLQGVSMLAVTQRLTLVPDVDAAQLVQVHTDQYIRRAA